MIAKIHKQGEQVILALCDENLLGKKFEEGKLILDLTSPFYKGEKIEEEKILSMIRRIYMINAVGENCVNFLKKNKLIKKENIRIIQKIPFTNVVILKD